jgi:hypothetical protein
LSLADNHFSMTDERFSPTNRDLSLLNSDFAMLNADFALLNRHLCLQIRHLNAHNCHLFVHNRPFHVHIGIMLRVFAVLTPIDTHFLRIMHIVTASITFLNADDRQVFKMFVLHNKKIIENLLKTRPIRRIYLVEVSSCPPITFLQGEIMRKLVFVAGIAAFMLSLGVFSDLSAQGRGGGRPTGAGAPAGVGRPSGVGVDRGIGNASTRSNGRSDEGLGNASTRSGGRSDTGLDRARNASLKAEALSDNELNRYRGLSKKLGTTPEEMRDRYEAALLANPDLKYGQFVSAHVVADNLGGRFPDITAANILQGYLDGDSLGRSLRNLGMTKEQAKAAERNAEDQIRAAKRRNER